MRGNEQHRVFVILFVLALMPAVALPVSAAAKEPDPANPARPGNIKKGVSFFEQGCRAAAEGNLAEAETLFTRALGACPLLPGAHVELGKIRMARKDPAGALERYLAAKEAYHRFRAWKMSCTLVGKGPRTALGIPDAQNFYFRHLRYGGRGEYTRHRTGLDAQAPSFVGQEGFAKEEGVFSFEKNRSEACLGMSAFAKLYPDQPESRVTLDAIAIPEGEEEIPALFYLYLGAAYLRLDRPADAERELMVGIAKDPSLAELYMNLSLARFLQDDYAGAANACRAAKKLGFDPPADYVCDLQARSGGRIE